MSNRLKMTAWLTLWAALSLSLTSLSCVAQPLIGPGDDDSPYRVGLGSARLVTPQWVDEPGVEAVVILSIDDMTDNVPKYASFLRPIMDRLKAIDGRAPVSILTCRVNPHDAGVHQLQQQGVRFDVHTLKHPCPLLQGGDFASAASNYHDCIDLVSRIPGQKPVAFRMPCCDSQNTVSPRFFSHLFNQRSGAGRFLTIDSSVFTTLTPDDPALDRSTVYETDGTERFRKYLPVGRTFVNLVENYPYPYTIGRVAWEFPCIVPSDWQAQNTHRPNNPKTVEDLKAALDGVVRKQGVFTFVFHPHGWISSEMVVSLIDHAVERYGKKVKFLTFQEAQNRINRSLLRGHSLRGPEGGDGGVRLVDLNQDGYLDVLIGRGDTRLTRVWNPDKATWSDLGLPVAFVDDKTGREGGVRLGRVTDQRKRQSPLLFVNTPTQQGCWIFQDSAWKSIAQPAVETLIAGVDQGVRFADLDGDATDELVAAGLTHSEIYRFSSTQERWEKLPAQFPGGINLVNERGEDVGTRLVDVDEDGSLDLLQSNESREALYLFDPKTTGWTRKVLDAPDSPKRKIPPLVRQGKDLGGWFARRHLWIQNEFTAGKADLVDRRSFASLLEGLEPGPKTPTASLRSIQVASSFRVELAAAEPLVRDPIAFDWSADGRLWVVEMGDYPLGLDGKGKAGGRIRTLEDTDGDGRYDRALTFLDNLPYPTGVLPWRKGVLISSAPDLIYAEDADGDGVADVRKVLFTGFSPGNPQHRFNGFALGLDGWVYGANGDSGGEVKSLATGRKLSISGRDFRFKPDSGEIEAESGQAQFGRWRDDWGRWFGNNNSVWAWQYVLGESELGRNPAFRLTSARQNLAVPSQVFPVSRTLPRFNMPGSANHVTSANSPTSYRDELFGPEYEEAMFVSEPVHNLVRSFRLTRQGSALQAVAPPATRKEEFLASTDNWFRPTSMRTGPDGALWIADMYRAVIEHPEWIPDDWESRLDLRAGHDLGRIYRVLPVSRQARPIPRLDRMNEAEWVAALESPNGWIRDTAQRLIQEKGGTSSSAALARLAATSSRSRTKIQALWTLANLGGLTQPALLHAFRDPHPQVRRTGARLALPLVKIDPELARSWLELVKDTDAEVRLEMACRLGDWSDPRAGEALATVAIRDSADPWIRAAVLSSAGPHAAVLLTRVFSESGGKPPTNLIEPLFASLDPRAAADAVARLRATILTPQPNGRFEAWQFSALAGFLKSGRATKGVASEYAPIAAAVKETLIRLEDDERAIPAIHALEPLGIVQEERRTLLRPWLAPQTSSIARRAAIEVLAKTEDDKIPTLLLEGWRGHSPATRDQVLEVLLSRLSWTRGLLSSLEDTCTPPGEIGGVYRERLLRHPEASIRSRAQSVFESSPGQRQSVIETYRAALKRKGNSVAGSAVFEKACASCHRLGGRGSEVGPDLSTVGDKPPEALLVALLDPNRAFEARYASYVAALKDGRVFTGLVTSESAHAITLRKAGGSEDVILRENLESLVGSGRSLMPEGLENDLSVAQVADLLAYLQTGVTPPKQLVGNQPATLRAEADGTYRLLATQAEIRGDAITFEPQYKNIGYWSGKTDRVSWRLDVRASGRYRVRLDYACPPDAAGDRVGLQLGNSRLEWVVQPTDSWDAYRTADLGVVELEPGETMLELAPLDAPRRALMDLRGVELLPIR